MAISGSILHGASACLRLLERTAENTEDRGMVREAAYGMGDHADSVAVYTRDFLRSRKDRTGKGNYSARITSHS